MRSNAGMANRQGNDDLRFAQVDALQLTLWLGSAWLGLARLGSARFGSARLPAFFLDCITLDDGTDRLSRNVGNKLPTYAA